MRKHILKLNEGATFIEAVVVVALVAIVITALIAGTVGSLRSTNFANAKSQGTKYAQEGVEFARRQRDLGWYSFYNRRNQTWCVDKQGNWTAAANCPVNIDNFFTRSIQLNWNAADLRMEVTVLVTWPDSGSTRRSEIRTYLTQWR